MSAITWALNGARLATIVCGHCRAVFDRDLPLSEAVTAKHRVEQNHFCTPAKPWRPVGKP